MAVDLSAQLWSARRSQLVMVPVYASSRSFLLWEQMSLPTSVDQTPRLDFFQSRYFCVCFSFSYFALKRGTRIGAINTTAAMVAFLLAVVYCCKNSFVKKQLGLR